MKISDIFSTPINTDESEKKRVSDFIRIILIISILVFIGLDIIKIITPLDANISDYILWIITVLVISFYLGRNRNIILIGIFYVCSIWLFLTVMAWTSEGVRDITIVAYLLIIFIAMHMAGKRLALAMSLFSICSLWALFYAEQNKLIIIKIDSLLNYSIDFSAMIIMAITLIILNNKNYQITFNRINNELQERKNAEEKLQKNELKLRKQHEETLNLNEELTETNLKIRTINQELEIAKNKAEESDRLKSAFLANLSHEIRTPMNSIKGFANMLYEHDSSVKQQEYIKIINQGADNLLQAIENIIIASKLEAKQLQVKETHEKLSNIFSEVYDFFTARNMCVALTRNFCLSDNEDFMYADFYHLKQIMVNLIDNAYKFTKQGGIEFGCHLDNKILHFYIKDSGIGIPEEKQAIILKSFSQADSSLSKAQGGLGLGLFIAKGLVELMDGRLWLESFVNKGTVFHFTIPYKLAEPETNIN